MLVIKILSGVLNLNNLESDPFMFAEVLRILKLSALPVKKVTKQDLALKM